MSQSPRAAIVLLLPIILVGANYYLITRRVTIFGGSLDHKLHLFLISLVVSLCVVLLQTVQFADTKFLSIIGSIGSRLIMLLPLLAIFMGVEHVVSSIILKNGTGHSVIRRILPLGLLCMIFAYGIWASLNTKVTDLTIRTDKVSQELKIMFLADLHVDDVLSRVHLKALKKQIEQQQPDLILIGGDFFNRPHVRQAQYYEVLSGITIPIYAVEGNHDSMGSDEKQLALRWIQDLTNIQFLFDESHTFPERNLQLIGIRDRGHGGEVRFSIQEALEKSGIESWSTFNIFLTHQPVALQKVEDYPIDLELAGHTHKLQIRGLHFISYLLNDYTYGLYEQGERKAFVTQGIGTRGLPVRLGTRSEIVMIHLLTNQG